MREEERLNDGEREAEEALTALRPIRPAFEVSRLMFEAARRANQRQVWAWRGIAAALAGGLVLSLVFRSPARVVEKPVYVQSTPRESPLPSPPRVATASLLDPDVALRGGNDYLAVRDRVLALGIRSLPRAQPAAWPVAPAISAPIEQQPPPTDSIHRLFDAMQFGGRS